MSRSIKANVQAKKAQCNKRKSMHLQREMKHVMMLSDSNTINYTVSK